jgi:transposase
LLRIQKTASDKERIQVLYLLKTHQAKTVQDAASLLGRHRVTVQKWLGLYRKRRLSGLLEHIPHTGQKHRIPNWAQEALSKRLQAREGFNRYGEICQWLESQLGIRSTYKTVHKLVRYRLKASPKVARPVSVDNTDERVETYKDL